MSSKVRRLIEYDGILDILPEYEDGVGAFKEFIIEEMLQIPTEKPDIEQIVKITSNINISETRIIDTPLGKSLEGQIVTGKKAVVKGRVLQKIEYVADEPTQSVHGAHFNIPFCNFIVLPEDYTDKELVIVTGYIEDIYAEQIGKRNIYKAVTILLDAEIR